MSRIVVPVVSDPVPAVVGTVRKPNLELTHGNEGAERLTGDKRPERLRYRQAFPDGRVDEVHEVGILVYGEPGFVQE